MSVQIAIVTNSGAHCDMEIEELKSVDGVPFVSEETKTDDIEEIRNTVIHLQGQIEAIYAMMAVKGAEA